MNGIFYGHSLWTTLKWDLYDYFIYGARGSSLFHPRDHREVFLMGMISIDWFYIYMFNFSFYYGYGPLKNICESECCDTDLHADKNGTSRALKRLVKGCSKSTRWVGSDSINLTSLITMVWYFRLGVCWNTILVGKNVASMHHWLLW